MAAVKIKRVLISNFPQTPKKNLLIHRNKIKKKLLIKLIIKNKNHFKNVGTNLVIEIKKI